MHVIIGIITAFAGLVWALYSLQNSGVDLNSFNPFAWARRRRWRKLYGTKPIYTLERPMEAAALLIVGVLKQEGEISREQKAAVVEIFESTFQLERSQAQDVFTSSVYLLKDELNLDQSVSGILSRCKDKFTQAQTASLIALLQRVATLEGDATESQQRIIRAVQQDLATRPASNGSWT